RPPSRARTNIRIRVTVFTAVECRDPQSSSPRRPNVRVEPEIHSSGPLSGPDQAGLSGKERTFLVQKIYVGNLPFNATEAEVTGLFSEYGDVVSVALPTDRETGRPRGFGFVEM